MSAFEQPRPARIRIETDSVHTIDVVVPCFVAVYPEPGEPTKVAFAAKVHTPQQLAELTAAVIRYATTQGVMQMVMHALTNTPTQLDARDYPALPPNTPPDDLPPHLRRGRG